MADYLDFYADDPATAVGLAYVEGIGDGRALLERFGQAAARKPLVLVKGGRHRRRGSVPRPATPARSPPTTRCSTARAAQAGITRAATVEEAFEAAATFATQPLPPGPNVVVLTTAGGWGVVTADAITRDPDLDLLPLPDDLRDAIDRAAAAALEPQQPGRLRRRRDPRHHPRGDATCSPRTPTCTRSSTWGSASSRTRPG